MNATSDENGLLCPMIFYILLYAILEPLKMRARSDKIFIVHLEKLLDLLLLGGLNEPLDSPLRLLGLMCQFHGVLEFLTECFLYYSWYVIQDSQLLVIVEVCFDIIGNCHEGDRILRKRLAKQVELENPFVFFFLPYFVKAFLHFGIRVRHSMSKPQLVIRVGLEFVFEAEREIEIDALASSVVVVQKCIRVVFVGLHPGQILAATGLRIPRDVILLIGDLFASQEPASTVFIVFPLGPDPRLHALLIKTSGLSEVKNIKLNFVCFLVSTTRNVFIQHFEVIPLIVPLRIQVILKPKIVLDVVNFGHFTKVPIFESGVENQYILLLWDIYLKRGLGEVPLS